MTKNHTTVASLLAVVAALLATTLILHSGRAEGGTEAGQGGACCLPDGYCVDMNPTECIMTWSGTYQGHGNYCDGNMFCGACCFPGGLCKQATEQDCSGTFQALGSTCTPENPCCATCGGADIIADGEVGIEDLLEVLAQWGCTTGG